MSMAATWSMGTSKSDSMVSTASGTPPSEKAALILCSPWPGISTQVSRMMDMTWMLSRSCGTWTNIIVSARPALGTIGRSSSMPDPPPSSEPMSRMFRDSSSTAVCSPSAPASTRSGRSGRSASSGKVSSKVWTDSS